MYSVSDLMNQDVTPVSADETLLAVQLQWGRSSQRFLPVVEDGRLIGMLARVTALAALKAPAEAERPVVVRDVMLSQVTRVRPGTPLRNAAALLLKNESRCLAVVDEKGLLVGVLTDEELLRFTLDLISDLDRLSDGLRRDASHDSHEESATG